MQYLVLKK
jgi:hypothetical protein